MDDFRGCDGRVFAQPAARHHVLRLGITERDFSFAKDFVRVRFAMIDFSSISRESALGHLLRFPLALLPRSAVVRIVQGPLRGYRWIVGAGPHGLWLGSYELPKQKRAMEFLKKGSVAYDIGANVGIYTLLFSECTGQAGWVHAFEPLPENLVFLDRHVRMNRRQNVSIHPFAVSSSAGKVRFAHTHSRFTGRLDSGGDMEVNAIALDEFVFDARNPAPSLMKLDVEGGELQVLHGARRLLSASPPIIFLATHGAEVHSACCDLLRSLGYQLEGIGGESIGMTDELVCLPPMR